MYIIVRLQYMSLQYHLLCAFVVRGNTDSKVLFQFCLIKKLYYVLSEQSR